MAFVGEEMAVARGGGVFYRFWFAVRLGVDLLLTAGRLWYRALFRSPLHSRDGDGHMTTLVQDVRFAFRSFRRSPLFFLGAVMTLGLGLGATTALFSVVDGVLFRDLPYPEGERLLVIGSAIRVDPGDLGPLSTADFEDLRANTTLARFAVASGGSGVLRSATEPEVVQVGRVGDGFLDIFGARVVIGRSLMSRDHEAGANRVVVLAHDFWRDRWGSDSAVIGRTVRLGDEPREIVGVLDASFRSPEAMPGSQADLWVPVGLEDEPPDRSTFFLTGVGLPRAGFGPGAVQAELNGILEPVYERDDVPQFITGVKVASLRDETLGDISQPLAAFSGAVVLLLLIGCANVANLMLARASGRQHEVTVRAVLGAAPARLVRQLLTESLVLGAAAAALGLALAYGCVGGLQALSPGGVPRLAEVGVDLRAFGFALLVTIVTAVLTGLVPAVHAARSDSAAALRGTGRSTTAGRSQGRLRGTLVVTETAMAVILVLGSGLLLNSFIRLNTVDPGFEPAGLMTMQTDLRYGDGIDREGWLPFYRDVLERVRALPGVESAALTAQVPFTRDGMMTELVPEGFNSGSEDGVWVPVSAVSGAFFETMGIPVVEGRGIQDADREDAEPVAVVNRAFVRAYWPTRTSALNLTTADGGPDEPVRRVVGVVGDVRHRLGDDPRPHVYIPFPQEPWRTMSVVVRTTGIPGLLEGPLRETLHAYAPGLPISRLAPVDRLSSASLVRPRFYVAITVTFGALALILALTGIYGTTAYSAGQRKREIGIRLALGAEKGSVVRMIVGRAFLLVSSGVAVGAAGGALLARLLSAYLFGVTPGDLPTLSATSAVVAMTAAVAAWIPARRAGGTDPFVTLREGG